MFWNILKVLVSKKESYIGLIAGKHLYINFNGRFDGYGCLSNIVFSNDDFLSLEFEII